MKDTCYLKAQCATDWNRYLHHPFVRQLADGTLPENCFRHYLEQDYLFLKHYARAFALAIYKSNSLEQMRASLPALKGLIEHEISLHITYCHGYGLSEHDLNQVSEDVATVAYTRYVLDCGHQGNLVDLFVALAPCGLGYAEIGRLLAQSNETILEGNRYRSWIEMYSGETFQSGSSTLRVFIDDLLSEIPDDSSRWETLTQIFNTATRMEIAFWQQGLDTVHPE